MCSPSQPSERMLISALRTVAGHPGLDRGMPRSRVSSFLRRWLHRSLVVGKASVRFLSPFWLKRAAACCQRAGIRPSRDNRPGSRRNARFGTAYCDPSALLRVWAPATRVRAWRAAVCFFSGRLPSAARFFSLGIFPWSSLPPSVQQTWSRRRDAREYKTGLCWHRVGSADSV